MFQSPEPVVWNPSKGNHPPNSWLAEVWKWLKKKFPQDLTQLEGFPIVKCSLGQQTALAKLTRNPKTIRQQSSDRCISLHGDVVALLRKAGITVLLEVPEYMEKHARFSLYVADASPEGVLKVLRNVGLQRSISAVIASKAQEKRSLREFLCFFRAQLSNDEKAFIKSLPIFEAIDRTSFINAKNKTSTAPRGYDGEISLKIKNASNILSVKDHSSNTLLKILNVPDLTMGDFLIKEVFPYLSWYTVVQITSLMCWVLRRVVVFMNESPYFCSAITSLNFVDAGQGNLVKPQELFDPRNDITKRLFEGENSRFPIGDFADDDILVTLCTLGLKTKPDQNELASLASTLHNFNSDQRRRKAVALLEFLDANTSLLTRKINANGANMTLLDFLQNIAWVPCTEHPTAWYPKCMPWHSDGNGLLKPLDVVASQHGIVVGAVMSVLQSEPTSQMKGSFGWDTAPNSSKVLSQLKIACGVDVGSLQGIEREQFWRMLKSIYKSLAATNISNYHDHLYQAKFAWVWNGQGFSSPNKIAFKRQINFDLEPHLYTLPREMQEPELHRFFTVFGVKNCFTEEELLAVLYEIKEKHDKLQVEREVIDKDKQLALDILHWIVRDGKPLREDLRNRVYVPVMKGPGSLKLVPLTECTFCDAAWLRGNFLELQMLPELSELSLIDESISNTTASHLGVPPMSKCVTAPEILGFEQAGPYEPITTRLKNILDEYKEGAGVFKELIQNADDAGATEVKFLVDWRQHSVKKLLAEGMKESQGPALLTYNNAIFTKNDFENINKLAGATKKKDLEKIGRFGLGFNSVYHFTDTPSFVSSHYAVFFDPDTHHLGHFITSPTHPGIKLNLAAKRNTLLCYPDQFQPYDGVFDCDVSGNTPFDFNGTLFRFPFRQGRSEICDKQYNKHDVDVLLESFNRSASTLLLNTQNVEHVSVWTIDKNAKKPSAMELLMKVDRTTLSETGSLKNTTFLQDCAEWSKAAALSEDRSTEDLPQRTKIISITYAAKQDGMKTLTDHWLQCDRLGDGESLQMATSEEGRRKGLLSCSGVTAKLKHVEQFNYSWKTQKNDGEAFCFLPLSIPTGLPVHVNGYFAVTSNRRGIWEETADEKRFLQPLEVQWNEKLMNDGIAKAYLQLLIEAAGMAQKGRLKEYIFCSLWPNPDSLQSQVWKPLIAGVYTLIASSSLPLMKSGEEWYSINDCLFPDDELQKIPGSLQILRNLGFKIVDLPQFARNGFKNAGCGKEIENRTLSQEKFLSQVFFPNIEMITGCLRDNVVCHVIDACLSSDNNSKKLLFQQLLSDNACIPCSSDPQVLARPRDLISPDGAAASLYSASDNKMPVGDCFCKPQRLLVLGTLGMVTDVLNWNHVLDRAKSVQSFKYDDGLKRISTLVKYLNHYISKMSPPSDETSNDLASLPIFPIMAKPMDYVFPWKGEKYNPRNMLSSKELFDKGNINIIGALKPVLDESEHTGCGHLIVKVRKLFRLSEHQPSVEDALRQLHIVCQHFQQFPTALRRKSMRHVSSICSDIYNFFQTFLGTVEETKVVERLQEFSWILVEDRFVSSDKLAFKWSGNGAPYLYRVPRSLANSQLLAAAGVKMTFSEQDFLSALNQMKKEKRDEQLDNSEFKVSKVFLDELNGVYNMVPPKAVGCVPIPDHDRVLRHAKDLVINDAPWVNMSDDIKYVHEDISINLAHALGAMDIRSRSLEDISRPVGQPFGQKELLTDRLAGILKSYPYDFGVLKELLQNADDAKATEIHFVYDPRHHDGERIFSDSWKELQGPALCVYNDRPFSGKDLEGIQRLGIGSKADSPEKTGQYGIGFNAVYHLTDCPSFISDGDTLCILDPQARYAPEATKENPGRIIGPFESHHKDNYRDVFPGYLGDIFPLRGSTMFRFPLRNEEMARKSLISKKDVFGSIESLLAHFKTEAKESLLFLNHVKKISISTIREDKLVCSYEVSADLKEEDEEKRRELAIHIQNSKHLPTHEIRRYAVTYPIVLKCMGTEEKWIVQQRVGVDSKNSDIEIPDGKQNGLLPRAGVAAKVTTAKESKEKSIPSATSRPEKRKAFCFLPLPVYTGLPVHVNGHFALDSGRRHLWQDEDESGFRTKWNNFMKTEVIADAYVSLLLEARKYIPYLKHTGSTFFRIALEANFGLEWYQGLFPSQSQSETQWKSVVVAVLNKIAHNDTPVFPLVRKENVGEISKYSCNWLSSSNGFFISLNFDLQLKCVLRSIGFKLICLPHQMYENFKEVGAPVNQMTPEHVMTFLSTYETLLEQLPCPVEDSSIESTGRYLHLLIYCIESKAFAKNLDGVPLLLTRDGFLRLFSTKDPVYVSAFSHLVPSPKHFERFAEDQLTTALEPLFKELFEQQSPVVLQMKLPDLEMFLPFIFQGHKPWSPTCIPVSWDPKQDDKEIAKWLVELWHFISKEYTETQSDHFLEPLKSWPVIPTTSGYLVPIHLSKTILDLTKLHSWTANQVKVVGVLRKLRCPEVDMKLISTKGVNVSAVVQSNLAYPNSGNDVIIVLDNLMKRESDISGRIEARDAKLLLQFLQEDSQTLEANNGSVSVLRQLPFYKTMDGKLIKLEGASSVYKVPGGIPLKESDVWMEGTKDLFVKPCQSLDVLHKILGVELKSQTSCYIDHIFPKFNLLKMSTCLKHLSYIRDYLLCDPNNTQAKQLQSALENLEFIPNVATGKFCKASNFHDPFNPVFKALLTTDKFPGQPFSSVEWITFLCDIGLQQTLSKHQVLVFAKEIEIQAIAQGVTQQLVKRSLVLTEYIIQETSLHESVFLQNISTVNFVVAYKVDTNLNSIVNQFSPRHYEDDSATLTSFRNAVPQEYKKLVWSTAALLPDWAVPCDNVIQKSLGILEKPTLHHVVMHANNICGKFSKRTDMDLNAYLRALLLEIMDEIYRFLQSSSFDQQSLQLLRNMPLVLVENGGVFVQCKQLTFELYGFKEHPPYLYKVPRNYGLFEDLFQRLGAVERPSPSQYVYILEQIWKSSQGKKMHADEMRNAKSATTGLFRALRRLHNEDQNANPKTTKCVYSLKDVRILYLPDQKRKLKPSNQLFHMYDCPQMLDRVTGVTSRYNLMLELSKCGFTNDRPDDLLSCLPRHLQVNSINTVLKEELHPECLDKKCRLDEDGQCPEASRLREILGSSQLTDGIVRILKAQERKATIKEEVRQKVENVRTMFTIVCFESLETVMKNDSDEEIEGSRCFKSYHFFDDEKTCRIFIRHGTDGFLRNMKICKYIYEYLEGALSPLSLLNLSHIIRLKQAEHIPYHLDKIGIEPDVQQLASEMFETKPGSIIPPEEHYLLMQFEDFLFRPDEIVGYDEEEDNLENEQGKYIYARIIQKIWSPSLGEKTKKKMKRKKTMKKKLNSATERDEKKENGLLGRYLIDTGTGAPIEVDVLDLYKLKRPHGLDDTKLADGNAIDSQLFDCLSIVPYEGEHQSNEGPTGANYHSGRRGSTRPGTLEQAKQEVRQALADIMTLPNEKRRKAIKRLYLRWHPDKNPGMEELATKVVQYIQEEFRRLSIGGSTSSGASNDSFNQAWWDTFFTHCDRQARHQRSSYDNYCQQRFTRNSSNSRSSWGSHGASFAQNGGCHHPPDATNARIWIIQSRADLESVERLFGTRDGLNWLICFQCSQVVEKALKAALYAVCGISDDQLESHDLIRLASDLKSVPRGPDVLQSAGELRNYHDPTRYPHKHIPAKPPKDVYTCQQAHDAYEIAKKLLQVLEEFIGILRI